MAAAFPFDPRHEVRLHDSAPGRSAIVEGAMMSRRTERGLASIGENRPAFGAGPANGLFSCAGHTVVISVGLCACIPYGNAPVKPLAMALQSLMGVAGVDTPMNSDDLADALRAPMPPNSEALTVQILGQIRDNLSAINRKQDKIGEDVSAINVRVVKLEEQDARLKRAESAIEKIDGKVDVLLRDKDQRDGAGRVFVGIRGWTPVVIAILSAIASIATALYLAGRQTGIIQPSQAVQHEVRAIERAAGAPYPNDGRER